jgi:hypothetical protein
MLKSSLIIILVFLIPAPSFAESVTIPITIETASCDESTYSNECNFVCEVFVNPENGESYNVCHC